ncbi:MAG: hypothetical protein BEV12_19695 [Microcystis aeruginosa CACIAM 03]|jgi:hypothetical protein|nr:MAG: hypothetical protein BEV12_19695 [Microcystis aeruginosa CACIAM 03]
MRGIIMSSEDKRKLLLEKVSCEAQSRLAYYDLLKQGEVFRQHLESLSDNESVKIEEIDKHFLKGFLSYSSRLYTTGEISKSAYISLVTQAAESYAERLVESKLAKALKKYELYLEKASLRWFL